MSLPAISRQFQSGTGMDILAESLTQVVGGTWRIKVVVEGVAADEPTATPAQPTPAALSDEPEPGDSDDLPADSALDPLAMLKSAFGATVIEERESS
jgi:hypothetical protein